MEEKIRALRKSERLQAISRTRLLLKTLRRNQHYQWPDFRLPDFKTVREYVWAGRGTPSRAQEWAFI